MACVACGRESWPCFIEYKNWRMVDSGCFHPFEVAFPLTNLANAHGVLGDHKTNNDVLERALWIEERHYGPDHFHVAVTLTNLAIAHGDLGDHKTMKEMLELSLIHI